MSDDVDMETVERARAILERGLTDAEIEAVLEDVRSADITTAKKRLRSGENILDVLAIL